MDGAGCPGERRLPSFTEAYTASVPFTRIRDIAHRGDIPHELKQVLLLPTLLAHLIKVMRRYY